MQKENKPISLSKLPKFQDWEVGSNYEIHKQIGSGSYGCVVEATQKSTGRKVAIKRVNNLWDDEIDCKRVLREVVLLRKLNNMNLIQIIEILEPQNKQNFDTIYIVLEHAQSDLKKLFKSPIYLTMLHIQTLTYNILCGLKYLHSADVLHRDLKPANVLINEDCTVKICDFGLARSVEGIEGAHIYKYSKSTLEEEEQEEEEDDEDLAAYKKSKGNQQQQGDDKNGVQLLRANRLNAKNLKRELTSHVVTRWYRAPELILLEKNYTAAIDVWSLGCIVAELLGTIKENAPTYLDRSPLFPGASCFPLSPDNNAKIKKGGFPFSAQDQMAIIFSVLGTPLPEELDFITDEKAVEYIKSFPKTKKINLQLLFPAAPSDAIDFLNQTLQFNPRKRITIDEALNHPFVHKVKDLTKELVADSICTIEFEKEAELPVTRLKELFLQEIQYYKNLQK